jgi:hypothetical protein
MTRPTQPPEPPPEDYPEDTSNGRPRRDPQSSGGPYQQGPQPTFTPREGYLPPPPDAARQAVYPQPTTTFFAPPGYPQPSFTPYAYGEAPPRRREPRPGGPDGRPPRGEARWARGRPDAGP